MISVNDAKLASSLIASCLIHAIVAVLAPTLLKNDNHRRQENLIPVGLVELTPIKQATPPREEEQRDGIAKPPLPSPIPKAEKLQTAEPVAKKPHIEQALPPRGTSPSIEEAVQSTDSHTTLPVDPVPQYPTAPAAGGGSEADAGNLFSKGEVGVIPGSGTGGGGGTAPSGLGRGSGTPGPAAPTTPLRTDREAKPVQTVRATYPPMALRMGLEGDVSLRIAIDSDGNVMEAEIIRSGGAGFDDEALKAVKQARFEPAQNEGRNVPAVFTYVYRFRLRR
jgi:TonB family protein